MGALPLLNQWLPQDDLLLKKSIEGGASLESLARGAVEFSRKFSIKELQDRWQSLLYDPAVSVEACARMVKFELSAVSSKSKKIKESKLSNGKRKHESIRSCYSAMRKRVCNGPLYEGDLSFLMDSFVNETRENVVEDPLANDFGLEDCNFDDLYNVSASLMGDAFLVGQENMLEDLVDQNTIKNDRFPNMIGNCNNDAKPASNSKDTMLSNCGTSYEHLRNTSTLPEMSTWKMVENILLHEIPDNNNDDNDVGEGILEDTDIHLHPVLTSDMSFNDFETSSGCLDDYFADMADFNLTNEDEMHINDDGNDGTCHGGIDTHLLNTPTYEIDDEMCNMTNIPEVNQPASTVPVESVPIPVKGDVAECHTSGSKFLGSVDQTSTSALSFDPRFPEYRNCVICCNLNTEDLEIPCNDDIFPSKKPANGYRRTQSKATVLSSSGKDNTATQAAEKIKKSHSALSLNVGLNCAAKGCEVEIDTQGYGSLCQISTAIKNEYPDFTDCDVTEKSGQSVGPNHVQMNVRVMNQEAQQLPSAPVFAAPMLIEDDDELVASENEAQNSDSDADIPCFSDVESMILDMDLGPADQEGSCSRKVEKYQQEDAMKEIIRLEQNALSYMQRDMASHGAFAKLFGRRSKHYIKKPKILLGRATGDDHVDVDLTREGPAKKISRKQASIELLNGTFRLKNLGKRPIYVNSEEISRWQHFDLYSNCLIEIGGMPFIFQVNQRRVKLYMDDVRKVKK